MKDVAYQLDRAVVTIMAEITEESMVDLVAEIDRLSTDYFYKTTELRITSPGGELIALDYYLDALRRFRKRGVQISTRALTQAGSAAASIVSLGDGPRTAGRTALLRYHFHRVSAEGDMTARTATALHLLLGQTDRKMVAQIAERAFLGYGRSTSSPEDSGRPQRGLDCFAESDWQVMNKLTGGRFDVEFQTSDKHKRACLAAIRKRVADECEQQPDPSGFLLLYGELFGFDINISAAFACELRLIDALADDDGMDSQADEPDRRPHSVGIPEWRNLFPPQGEIARADLCRHVMAFGETGSGKTQSAIVPSAQWHIASGRPGAKGRYAGELRAGHRPEEGASSNPGEPGAGGRCRAGPRDPGECRRRVTAQSHERRVGDYRRLRQGRYAGDGAEDSQAMRVVCTPESCLRITARTRDGRQRILEEPGCAPRPDHHCAAAGRLQVPRRHLRSE